MIVTKVVNFIKNYFHRPSQLSIEVARITFGVCSLLIFQYKQLFISGHQVHNGWNVNNYFPKGVLAFLGETAPSIETIDVWMFLQFWSAIFLVIGLFSRITLLVNFICNLLLISLSESFSVSWSHGFNMNLLAQMPFIFAPAGRLLSIDFLINRYIRKKTVEYSVNAIYLWMTNFGIVTIFFNAFFWKLFTTRKSFSFDWAFSDNFRNQIIIRYSYLGEDIPAYLNYIVNNEWAWQSVAFLNLMFQALPFLSLFFFKKPIWRLILGSLFVFEELGLMVVMQLYDYQWIPLILLFVDWDYFLGIKANFQVTFNRFEKLKNILVNFLYVTYIAAYLILCFNVFYFINGKLVNSKNGINSYPFSSYTMYSSLLSKNEYGNVKVLGFGIKFSNKNNSDSLTNTIEKTLWRKYYGYAFLTDSNDVINAIDFLKNYTLSLNKDFNTDSIFLMRNIYEFNQYPKPAGVTSYIESFIGIKFKNKFYYLYPQCETKSDTVFIKPQICGFVPSNMKLKVFNYKQRKLIEWKSDQWIIPKSHKILEDRKVVFIIECLGVGDKSINFSGNITYI